MEESVDPVEDLGARDEITSIHHPKTLILVMH